MTKLTFDTDQDILDEELINQPIDVIQKYDLVRIVEMDEEVFPMTAEFVMNRINVIVKGGLIVDYFLG